MSLFFILGRGGGVAGVRISYERWVHDQVQGSAMQNLQKPVLRRTFQMNQMSVDQVWLVSFQICSERGLGFESSSRTEQCQHL